MGEGRPSSSAKRSPGPFPRTPPRDPARRPLRQCPIQPGPGPRPGAGRAAPLGEPPRPAAGRRVLGTRGQLRCQRLSPRGRRACRRRGETGRKGGGEGWFVFSSRQQPSPRSFTCPLRAPSPALYDRGRGRHRPAPTGRLGAAPAAAAAAAARPPRSPARAAAPPLPARPPNGGAAAPPPARGQPMGSVAPAPVHLRLREPPERARKADKTRRCGGLRAALSARPRLALSTRWASSAARCLRQT